MEKGNTLGIGDLGSWCRRLVSGPRDGRPHARLCDRVKALPPARQIDVPPGPPRIERLPDSKVDYACFQDREAVGACARGEGGPHHLFPCARVAATSLKWSHRYQAGSMHAPTPYARTRSWQSCPSP
eukprot:350975-Chlamydomonas_euryale.AAC.8